MVNQETIEFTVNAIFFGVLLIYIIPLLITVRGIYLFGKRKTLVGAGVFLIGIISFVIASIIVLRTWRMIASY